MPDYVQQVTEFDGKKYQYFDTGGVGEFPIVFLHGYAGSKDSGLMTMKLLFNSFRVLSIDLPGHNGLDFYDSKSLDDLVNYVDVFIKHMGIEKFALVGFSMGGLLAIEYARKFPDSGVKAIAAWASPICGTGGVTRLTKAYFSLMSIAPGKLYEKLVHPKNAKSTSTRLGYQISDADIDAFSKVSKKVGMKLMNIMRKFRLPGSFSVPTLFVYDVHDPFVDYESCKRSIISVDPNVKIVSVSNGGHLGSNDEVEQAIMEIKKFLLPVGK